MFQCVRRNKYTPNIQLEPIVCFCMFQEDYLIREMVQENFSLSIEFVLINIGVKRKNCSRLCSTNMEIEKVERIFNICLALLMLVKLSKGGQFGRQPPSLNKGKKYSYQYTCSSSLAMVEFVVPNKAFALSSGLKELEKGGYISYLLVKFSIGTRFASEIQ